MKRVWNPDEMADQWTLTPRERVLVIPALIEHVKSRCYELHLELPTPDRVERLVRTAIATFDAQFTAQIVARLSPTTCERLDALLHERPQVRR